MDAAQTTERGLLIRRALDLRIALRFGIRITLDEIRADEFLAMQVLEEEADRHEREQVGNRPRR